MFYWRYRFKTKEYKDKNFHSKFDSLQMPYWISAEYEDQGYAIVTCYLPPEHPLQFWFKDAADIEAVQCESIKYSERFPKPYWIKDGEV